MISSSLAITSTKLPFMTKINFQNLAEFSNRQLPLPRTSEGKDYYGAADFAQIFDINALLNAAPYATMLLARKAPRS